MKNKTRNKILKNVNHRTSFIVSLALCFLLLISCFSSPSLSGTTQDNYPEITRIESLVFGKTFSELKTSERLTKIEKSIFGKSFESESPDKRTDRIQEYISGEAGENHAESISNSQFDLKKTKGYENTLTKVITSDKFIELFYENLNKERSIKGLLPLTQDAIGTKVAQEQSQELIMLGHLSYYNSKKQCPDERYTLSGGTGAIIEIVKGFEVNEKTKLTELLALDLIEALKTNKDDSNVLFSPYITHIGFGFSISPDKKDFASAVEFLTKGGEFEPIKPQITLGEKFFISGKIKTPFKFKAVSVAYFEPPAELNFEDQDSSISFDPESLVEYFPPQDFIAYTDKLKGNVLNVLKGIGVIGAILGSPFTGGATAVLAPVLLSSIQNGPPKEIPLKGGIDTKSDGSFKGSIDITYQGMCGLYFVSVLGELPNLNFPIVLSRRTVRVNNPLQPVSQNKCSVNES